MAVTADWLAKQPTSFRRAFYDELGVDRCARLKYEWGFWSRPEQWHPEGAWSYWLILAGRGFGKTRTGAEWVRQRIRRMSYVNLIGATADDARDVMVEGESGILSVCPNKERPRYVKGERKLLWPNGAVSLVFTADEPERLRGKQHCGIWADELAAWRYPDAWDQAMFGLRIGVDPRAIITTTPRPTQIIKDLLKDPNTHITKGSTYDNRFNLAATFYSKIISKYEGTRLGRQELMAELLDDNPNALWQRSLIDRLRVKKLPELKVVVVAVDPQAGTDGAETGIIVCGLGEDDHGYLLEDASISGSPNEWATAAVMQFQKWKANRIVAETNQGGEMVENTIRTVAKQEGIRVAYRGVHASRGKYTRAEPVAALAEQGLIHHYGTFSELEDQLCEWDPTTGVSPDRLDAKVWGFTDLMLGDQRSRKGVGV